MTRVIAGELGGRRLATPSGASTRPTTDRVREALFSVLGEIDGAAVLDLFAGSGALGIEALSRGAARATFVERDDSAHAALARNLESLGLAARARVARAESVVWLRRAARLDERYDLVFLDPPYAEAARLSPLLSRTLPPVLCAPALVVSESSRRLPLELALPLRFERRYGDTLIRIHELT